MLHSSKAIHESDIPVKLIKENGKLENGDNMQIL